MGWVTWGVVKGGGGGLALQMQDSLTGLGQGIVQIFVFLSLFTFHRWIYYITLSFSIRYLGCLWFGSTLAEPLSLHYYRTKLF